MIKCPHCDVSLSLHRGMSCAVTIVAMRRENRGSVRLVAPNISAALRRARKSLRRSSDRPFPMARVLRMDTDTTRGKNGHQEILDAFRRGQADILIGTQMIVKGHDFPNVTLVGVLAADLSLNSSDFHSGERTFQLLTQAAGRAGRGDIPGNVVMQTYQPTHYSILAAKDQDYEAFYEEEIAYRELMDYPPAAHML